VTNRRNVVLVFMGFLALSAIGCDEQLGPSNEPSGFAGVIRFKNWPVATDIKEMRLVAFENVPRDSGAVLLTLLAGKAAAFPPVTQDYFQALSDSIVYVFTDRSGTNLQVKNYEYVAVMYQYGPDILTHWRPAGVYSTKPGSFEASPLRVILHRVIPNVDINVDFNNLPPPPWRR
jgi:hypothetical protein